MSKRSRIAATVILFAMTNVLFVSLASAGCTDYTRYTHWVGGLETPGSPNAVALAGSFAVVAMGSSGIATIDVSDPAMPFVAGEMSTPGSARGVAITGRTALIADDVAGLTVVDLSTPAAPRIAGRLGIFGIAGDVALNCCGVACVAAGVGGLLTVDVSSPEHPALLGTLALPGAVDLVTAWGHVACAGASADSLVYLVDTSNPRAPRLLTHIRIGSATSGMILSNDTLYVAEGGPGWVGTRVEVIDVSRPSSPGVLGIVSLAGEAGRIALAPGKIVAADLDVLSLVAVSPAGTPSLAWHTGIPAPPALRRVACSGTHIYVASENRGFDVFELSDPDAPPVYSTTPVLTRFREFLRMGVTGSTACFTGPLSGHPTDTLFIADLTDSANGRIVSSVPLGSWAAGLTARDHFAYVTYGETLDVVDIADPGHPALVRSIALPGFGSQVAVTDSLICVNVGSWLQVIVPSRPDSLALAGRSGYMVSNGLAAAGERIYATTRTGFEIVDVADPDTAVIEGTLPLADAGRVLVTGSVACVLVDDYPPTIGMASTLYLVDVSDPGAPAVLSSLALPGTCRGMCMDNDFLYLPCVDPRWLDPLGTLVVDIADPRAPRALVSIPDRGSEVHIANGNLWSIGVNSGSSSYLLTARPVHCAGSLAPPGESSPAPPAPDALSLLLTPNPSAHDALIRFHLPYAGGVTFDIMDVRGRLVRRMDAGMLGAGGHEICWDARDDAGRAAASGVYFTTLRLRAGPGGRSAAGTVRFVLIR